MTRAAVALILWAALIVLARVWGLEVVSSSDEDLKIDAVPFYGTWDVLATWRLVAPVAVGAVAVAVLPRLAAALRWRWVLATAGAAAVVWSLALAFVDPDDTAFGDIQYAYARHTHLVDDAGGFSDFLRSYVENQDSVPVHLQAHPPGFVTALWAAERAGASGPALHTALALAAVAVAVVAVLALTRDVAGEAPVRLAAPFLVLAPAAVWHTNADVVFGGVGLAAVALVVLATGRHGRASVLLAAGGGALFGAALLLSYGLALLAVPIGVIAVWRRRWTMLAVAAAAGALVTLLPLVWGFWWLDGLTVTREQYYAGVGSLRPHEYFVVANLAVFAVAIGPATAVGLSLLRNARVWLVAGSGLLVVALADLSGLSSAETERIWQPFMPLVLVATVAVGAPPRTARWWLSAQVATAVVVQAVLRSPW